MIKFGPAPGEMRKMSEDDIFPARLKLLIIMAKSFLKGNPIGNFRKQAIIENAHHVFYQSLQFLTDAAAFKRSDTKIQPDPVYADDIHEERIFHQRVQLLAVMAKALAEGRLKGKFREKALQDNLSRICETLIFNFHIKDVSFLKVA